MPETTALTQADFDQQNCHTPGCTHTACTLHLVPRCHANAALLVRYDKVDGVLTMTCGRCRQLVTRVEVAP